MSDLNATSYYGDKKTDGLNPMLLILMLLFLGGGDNCFSGGFNSCSTSGGCSSGLGSMLPMLMLLLSGSGSF